MTQRLLKGAIINLDDLDPFELGHDGQGKLKTSAKSVGLDVTDALARASYLRRYLSNGEPLAFGSADSNVVPDVLYGMCQLLLQDIGQSPKTVLEETARLRAAIEDLHWDEDAFDERSSIGCSLAFISWRAARLLNHSREAQRWEAAYKKIFLASLEYQVALDTCGPGLTERSSADLIAMGAEAIFQILIALQETKEADPRRVAASASSLHGAIASAERPLEPDLKRFFLAETARLTATVLRGVGSPQDVQAWIEIAERHFQADVNPEPHLARTMFVRLAAAYSEGRLASIPRLAEELDRRFRNLGMEEDWVKNRILRVASLKLLGRFDDALACLEALHRVRDRIRPGLYGWVMFNAADIHQILGNYELALDELTEAAELLRSGRQLTALADVGSLLSCVYRAQGRLEEAVSLLKISQRGHAELGMQALEAFDRVLVAETYLAMGRPREAEAEVRAALPILDQHAAMPDAVAALSILREALRRQTLEPQSLRDARKHLRQKD